MWQILITTDRQVGGEDGRERAENYGDENGDDHALHQV
jgi:hypothetical protein